MPSVTASCSSNFFHDFHVCDIDQRVSLRSMQLGLNLFSKWLVCSSLENNKTFDLRFAIQVNKYSTDCWVLWFTLIVRENCVEVNWDLHGCNPAVIFLFLNSNISFSDVRIVKNCFSKKIPEKWKHLHFWDQNT